MEVVVPGERLCADEGRALGEGVFSRNGSVYASLTGKPLVTEDSVSVVVERRRVAVPDIGDVVVCRCTRLTTRVVGVEILLCGDVALPSAFPGVIRKQDIRETDIDRVEVYSSYRPGDILRAEVISLGDARSYFLTTAKTGLGVIHALSAAGEPMAPISDREMCCKKTLLIEPRKVAKIDGDQEATAATTIEAAAAAVKKPEGV